MSPRLARRLAATLPSGVPRYVRLYDYGGSGDRYTCVYTRRPFSAWHGVKSFGYVGMSGAPYHPQGVCCHGENNLRPVDIPEGTTWPVAVGRKCHLGRRITWNDLPLDCRRVVMADYCDLWDIPADLATV